MNKDEMQKQILEALTSGKIQATQIIVGDNVAKKIEVHEGGIGEQTNNYYYGQQPENSAENNQQPSAPAATLNKVAAAIKAVFDSNLCESADWVAVTRLLQERGLKQENNLPYDADYINAVCGQEVTSSTSIARSFMTDKVGGRYPQWYIKQGEETRESPNKLRRYNDIAKIVADILDN